MAESETYGNEPQFTGGILVTFKEGTKISEQRASLARISSEKEVKLFALDGGDDADQHTLHFEDLGIGAISNLDKEFGIDVKSLSAEGAGGTLASIMKNEDAILSIEPELWVYALPAPPTPPINDLPTRTWGIDAVNAHSSSFTGQGIKVAVLDTGFFSKHPDFAGRMITEQNFSRTPPTNDIAGHGTHCIGNAVGNGFHSNAGNFVRYGVAYEADIFVGKVLGDNGSGRQRDIIAGMNWAINQGCEVISMSLGSSVFPGQGYSQAYEVVAQKALREGCLIVAASGNESQRSSGHIAPVGSPANAPSIMAVAALNQSLTVADFSCGDVNKFPGSAIDVSAPGVNVFSSWPSPKLHNRLRGTSMACPHVAGVAALFAQSNPSLRGKALWKAVVNHAASLAGSVDDIGSGLVQAP